MDLNFIENKVKMLKDRFSDIISPISTPLNRKVDTSKCIISKKPFEKK